MGSIFCILYSEQEPWIALRSQQRAPLFLHPWCPTPRRGCRTRVLFLSLDRNLFFMCCEGSVFVSAASVAECRVQSTPAPLLVYNKILHGCIPVSLFCKPTESAADRGVYFTASGADTTGRRGSLCLHRPEFTGSLSPNSILSKASLFVDLARS